MPTIADILGWTDRRVDLSRLAERSTHGTLGRSRVEPEPPAWQRDIDPSDEEEERAA